MTSPPAIPRRWPQFSTGIHTVTASAGHNIHLEQPQLVITAIEQVIALASDQEKRRLYTQARTALFSQLDQVAALLKAGRTADAAKLVADAISASKFGEADINKVGYELLGKRGQPQVAELVLGSNAQTHAQSDNAQDSYGEVLLGAKKPAEAKARFLNAIALAEKQGKSDRVLGGYRSNLAMAEQELAR